MNYIDTNLELYQLNLIYFKFLLFLKKVHQPGNDTN